MKISDLSDQIIYKMTLILLVHIQRTFYYLRQRSQHTLNTIPVDRQQFSICLTYINLTNDKILSEDGCLLNKQLSPNTSPSLNSPTIFSCPFFYLRSDTYLPDSTIYTNLFIFPSRIMYWFK